MAVIDGGTSGVSYILVTTSASVGWSHIDIIYQNNGASASSPGVTASTVQVSFIRCVFSGMRGEGVTGGTGSEFIECEAFGNNLSNTASKGGFASTGFYQRCISHDNTGSNTAGFFLSTSSANAIYQNCIADTNGGRGFDVTITTGNVSLNNCDAYNNTSDGIRTDASSGTFWVENCNLVKNGGWGINFSTSNRTSGFVYNCGFGAGTQVNTSGTTTGTLTGQEVGSFNYTSNTTPWVDPANGVFNLTPAGQAAAQGRGAFTTTASSYGSTVGYPDTGAAEAPTPTATATFTPTPTATATASFTPCAPTPGPTATSTPTPTPTATSTSTPTPTPSPTAPIEMSYGFQG